MQIIIPMAGLGKRFVNEGYKDPKPLIRIDGKPIIEHIVSLFPGDHKFIFIANNEHLQNTNMREILQNLKPNAQIIEIPVHSLGPVETILQAEKFINPSLPTIVSYCDIFLNWNFSEFEIEMAKENYDAALVAFTGFHPPLAREGFYAGILANKQNPKLAAEVKEKHSFTEDKTKGLNSAGVHYFKSGKLLTEYAKKLAATTNKVYDEYYVSMLHQPMINDGLKNGIFPVEYFVSWGKPQDVREYLYWSNYFNK